MNLSGSSINCCKDCKPPKRTPTCHITCKEYRRQKEASEAKREEINRKNKTNYDIYDQRAKNVYKALKQRQQGGKYAKQSE